MVIYNQMVVDQILDNEQADRVFHALADGTRRDILLRTLEGEHNVSALARGYPMSFAAVQKHVAVLAAAGIVTKQRRGREVLVTGDIDAFRRAFALLAEYEAMWRSRLDRFEAVLDEDEGE